VLAFTKELNRVDAMIADERG